MCIRDSLYTVCGDRIDRVKLSSEFEVKNKISVRILVKYKHLFDWLVLKVLRGSIWSGPNNIVHWEKQDFLDVGFTDDAATELQTIGEYVKNTRDFEYNALLRAFSVPFKPPGHRCPLEQ